jgi:tetratricopeptide (TPR) repeat protein
MRHTAWAVLAIGVAAFDFCAAAEQPAGSPIPTGKKAYTQQQFDAAHLKFSLVDVDSYRKHTQDPASVRDAAAEFIGQVYTRNVLGRAKPTWEELNRAGQKLLDDGSTDPLVLSQSALVLGNLGRFQETSTRLTEAIAAFKKSTYPVRPRYRAIDRLIWAMERQRKTEELAPQMPEYRKLAIEWLQSAADQSDEPRFLVYAVHNIFRAKPLIKDQEALCEACRSAPRVSEWIRKLLLGRYHTSLAWFHRGGDFANALTPEKAARFEENLNIAARHYHAAWEINRRWPEAPAEMIGVSMSLANSKFTPREWFDRAVAAQLDFPPAYHSMLWALRPRWGGSHDAMYRFGLECLATQRFDTDVPFQLLQALIDIQSETSGAAFWQRPDVYQNVKAACEGMEREPSRADDQRAINSHSYTMSVHAAAAMHARQFPDARRLFNSLGDRVQSDVFDKLRRRLDDDRPMAIALTGKGGPDAARALPLLDSDDPATRLKAYELFQSASRLDNDPRAQVFYHRKLGPAEWELAFATGQWVDLTFDPQKNLWDPRKGSWQVVGTRQVVGKSTPPDEGMVYVCRALFPPPLEIELDVECLRSDQRTLRAGLCVGLWRTDLLTGPAATATGMLFWADGSRNRSGLARVGDLPWSLEQPLAKPSHLHLRVWNDYFDFSCDGRLLPVHCSGSFVPETPIALANSHWLQETGEVRFSNLRVRKLSAGSPPPESDDASRVRYYTDQLRSDPDDPYARSFRAIAHHRLGNIRQAQSDLRDALAKHPQVAETLVNHAEELASMHEDFSLAQAMFELVLLVRPHDANAHRALAWFLATCEESEWRNGSLAFTHAQQACKLTGDDNWKCLLALAAAHAELSQFDDALKAAQQAQKSAPQPAQEKIRKMLDQFHARHPYHEPKSKRSV